MDSLWSSILDLFSTVIEIDGVPFVEVGEAISVIFIICFVCFGDVVFSYFVGSSLFAVVKALAQRFIYPGIKNNRKSSGSAPDENIKNIKMKGNCENEKND